MILSRTCLLNTFAISLALVLFTAPLYGAETIHHDIKVRLYPQDHRFTAEDRVTLPQGFPSEFEFQLHAGLKPQITPAAVRMEKKQGGHGEEMVESYAVILPTQENTFVIKYGGPLDHPLQSSAREQARGFQQTPGIISKEGVFLSGSSSWYPQIGEHLLTFTLEITLPAGWNAVSQGKRTRHDQKLMRTVDVWESPEPQEEVYLIAGKFTEYTKSQARTESMVFLRTPDPELARKYLDATGRYLSMYEKLIGPYPYEKFALVENFWETGYGMPSFTLLGSKIIRFPFILTSSYPHEILHNWWGNSVYPDYSKGNWAEGLTAYLSDHLFKEQLGQGAAYRQAALQKYTDYVFSSRDFPLSQFRSRHSSSSEAVGYGKALMFFHMLRRDLGDEVLRQGLQDLYREKKFQTASFDDLRKSFERVSGNNLNIEFDQWITRPGAPEIRVKKIRADKVKQGYRLTAVLEQVQPEEVYSLSIPVAVTLEGKDRAYETVITITERSVPLDLEVPERPLRLDVDPEFDLFRRLHREEIPPALTQALGSREMLILVPSAADPDLVQAYEELGRKIAQSGPDRVEVKLDKDIKKLPGDRAVMLLGWENGFRSLMDSAVSEYDVTIGESSVHIKEITIPRENHAVVLTGRHPENKDQSITWIASDREDSLPGLARKLPHYHKYSYLGFQGNEPVNMAKGRWPVLHSPMALFIPQENGTVSQVRRGTLAKREPLANLPPIFSSQRIMETIQFLSSDELMGRGFGSPGLDRTAEYIAEKFKEAGLQPAGDEEGSYFQTWEERGGDPERPVTLRNVLGIIPGKDATLESESLVVGAHYDGLGLGWPDVRGENKGKIHYGADDNASGVAVLMELARTFTDNLKPDRTIIFAAFTGEEAGRRGSRFYLDNPGRFPPGKCIAMLNLDTVGRLVKNKLLIIGSESAGEWEHIFRGAGFVTGVKIEILTQELDASDQKSFHDARVPAVQLFTGPHLDYHRPTDTADKIDLNGLVKVASVAREAVEYLAGRKNFLSSTLKPDGTPDRDSKTERKVSLGTIPDFTFSGEGCMISGVAPGSAAESCGLRTGDVIVGIGSDTVSNLRDMSRILKSLYPGDRVSITFQRDGKIMEAEAELMTK